MLRNLRNFDDAGISDVSFRHVARKLTSLHEVANSRQFPYRFLSAYNASQDSDRWRTVIGEALDASTANIPALPGSTLVLVDTSASMEDVMSAKSTVRRVDAGALFAAAAAHAAARTPGARVDLYGFAGDWGRGRVVFAQDIPKGSSVMSTVTKLRGRIGEAGHGTMIGEALQATYAGHDRVMIFTDEQGADDASGIVPDRVPVYAFDLGGYASTSFPAGPNRFQLAGVSDSVFDMLPILEVGRDGTWPF